MLESAMTGLAAASLGSAKAVDGDSTVVTRASDCPAMKPSVHLPAEIVLEILTVLAQHGQEHARNALYVSKSFYPALAKYHHFKIHWRNIDGFQRVLKEQRKKLEKVTFDLRVKVEDEEGLEPKYCMGSFLKCLSKIDLRATEVIFMDLYTRLYAYAVPLNAAFASSIKSLTCIESGSLTRSEKPWAQRYKFSWLTEASCKSINLQYIPSKTGRTCFSSCTELWWEVSTARNMGSHFDDAFTFPALEYLYVIVPKSEHQPDYGDGKGVRLFVDELPYFSSLERLNETIKVAFIILWEGETPNDFEKELQRKFEWVKNYARKGLQPYHFRGGFYSRAAIAAFHSPDGEVLNTPEGKAKIRAMLHDEWNGMTREFQEAQEAFKNGNLWL